jgi:serine/threonine protein kinase
MDKTANQNNQIEFSYEKIENNQNIIDGRFLLQEKLGEGFNAIVYKCFDLELNRYFALKLIRDLVVRKFGKKAIENEIKYLEKLNEYDVSSRLYHFTYEGKKWDTLTKRYEKKVYLVLELMENGEFFDLRFIKRSFPVKIARFFFKQLVDCLMIFYKLNIGHRDLKMENIVVDREFNLKIIDFGFSTDIFDKSGEKILHRDFVGTEKYRAPELNENKPYHADKADVFTLGVILFSMLKGKSPFSKSVQSDKFYKYIYRDDSKTYWNIVNDDNITSDAIEIIDQMLCYNFYKRIEIEDLLKSKFYNGECETTENVKSFFKKS